MVESDVEKSEAARELAAAGESVLIEMLKSRFGDLLETRFGNVAGHGGEGLTAGKFANEFDGYYWYVNVTWSR